MHKLITRSLFFLSMSIISAIAVEAQIYDPVLATCLQRPLPEPARVRQRESCSQALDRNDLAPTMRASVYAMRGWLRTVYDDKIADFTAALEILPSQPLALVGRAGAYLNSGRSDLALADYTQALEFFPDDVQLLIGRGDAYNNLGRYDEGIADFDRALAISPYDEEALNDRAYALDKQGKHREAIKGYDRALAAARRIRDIILANRCLTKSVVGDDAGALADCDAAVALNPEHASVRGVVHLRMNRLDAAIKDFAGKLALETSDAFALFGRGIARVRKGDDGGRADLQRADQLSPQTRTIYGELGLAAP